MTTTTLTGLFDRLGPELSAFVRRAIQLPIGRPTPPSVTLPRLRRIRAPTAPGEWGSRNGARRSRPSEHWIGGEPEPLSVIGAPSDM